MKVIIAGSRTISDFFVVKTAIEKSGFEITEVVSGNAAGVDRLGERWAVQNNILITKFPADWNKHGKAAGFIRNREMAEYADALIAVWNGESAGTKDMIDQMKQRGKPIFVDKP